MRGSSLGGALRAGGVYGLGLLAAGWMLGPLRALVVAPRLGPVGAALAEGPLLLGAAAALVWLLQRRGWLPQPRAWRLIVGVAALATLFTGEAIGALAIYGADRIGDPFRGAPGAIGLILAGLCALTPLAPPEAS